METLLNIREKDHVQQFANKTACLNELIDDSYEISNPRDYLAYHIGAYTNCFKPDELLYMLLRFTEKCNGDVSDLMNENYSRVIALHTIYSTDINDSVRKILTFGIEIPVSFIHDASERNSLLGNTYTNTLMMVRAMIIHQNFNPCKFDKVEGDVLRYAISFYVQYVTLFNMLIKIIE
jgi:hypothetical protein